MRFCIKNYKKMWRLYMHADPEHIEAYFIKGNPYLASEYEFDGDVIWSRSHENLIPGILNKTIMSMEALLPRIKTEFNYVLRTNLSSFYVFPRLLNFLKNCPRRNFYCGSDTGDPAIGSGCGFLLSPDLVELLINNKKYLLDNISSYDDVILGTFLKRSGVPLISHKRMSFYTLEEWNDQKNIIMPDIFQFRIKNQPALRLSNELYIHLQLLKMFYPSKYPGLPQRSSQN